MPAEKEHLIQMVNLSTVNQKRPQFQLLLHRTTKPYQN